MANSEGRGDSAELAGPALPLTAGQLRAGGSCAVEFMRMRDFLDVLQDCGHENSPLYVGDVPCPEAWAEWLCQRFNDSCVQFTADLARDLPTPQMQKDAHCGVYVCLGKKPYGSFPVSDIAMHHSLMVYGDGARATWLCARAVDTPKLHSDRALHVLNPQDPNLFANVVQEFQKKPYIIFIAEQQEGDLVVFPPDSIRVMVLTEGRAAHITWNVHSAVTVEHAFNNVIPRLRKLYFPDKWNIPALAFFALKKTADRARNSHWRDCYRDPLILLLHVVDAIAHEEVQCTVPGMPAPAGDFDVQLYTPRTCVSCKASIFNICYQCVQCCQKLHQSFVFVCLSCVAEGSGCEDLQHYPNLVFAPYLSTLSFLRIYDNCQRALSEMLQQVCSSDEEINDFMRTTSCGDLRNHVPVLLIAENRKKGDLVHRECHDCQKARRMSQMALCTSPFRHCSNAYCADCLRRHFSLTLIDVLRTKDWQCPQCEGRCHCRRCGGQHHTRSPSSGSRDHSPGAARGKRRWDEGDENWEDAPLVPHLPPKGGEQQDQPESSCSDSKKERHNKQEQPLHCGDLHRRGTSPKEGREHVRRRIDAPRERAERWPNTRISFAPRPPLTPMPPVPPVQMLVPMPMPMPPPMPLPPPPFLVSLPQPPVVCAQELQPVKQEKQQQHEAPFPAPVFDALVPLPDTGPVRRPAEVYGGVKWTLTLATRRLGRHCEKTPVTLDKNDHNSC
eukprot:TRINITY_DN2147_c0_g1_i1.p1 TRINITY_DN2147_c0_g1~~TRINITY_DN2147_c0_g1_i1.p1  ORF type:complete len:810 (-),score=159.20 TRINITY_DN2147_c0_g1_i1:552-2729(-)